MKVLIPMAGMGKRFLKAGYREPKPLIRVDGIPVIEHILHNFSADDDFAFGVNHEHAEAGAILETLTGLAPSAKIIVMPYQREGPVASIRRMFEAVRDEEAVIVNYCDFSWAWDYEDFKRTVSENGCDGAVICYRGFHPHLLGPNLYATLASEGLWMKEIREKHSWHKTKMKDWTSSGTYYFKKGRNLKKYFQAIEARPEWRINGEFYASQVFQLMKEDGLKISIYEIPFMLQWGTPEDLEEYQYWSGYFRAKENPAPFRSYPMRVVILMAGAGKRFSDEGYRVPKPYIPVDDSFMVRRSAEELPRGDRYLFITRRELGSPEGEAALTNAFPGAEIKVIEELTQGQACTALLAEPFWDPEGPLLIGACDHSILWDPSVLKPLIEGPGACDSLIFTYRHNPMVRRNPKMYGWVETDRSGRARRVSVKVPLAGDPAEHHAIIGSFWFKKARYFSEHAKKMIAEDSRINGEFYIDQCINYLIKAGLDVRVFEVGKYASWGTPNDLRTYEYWQRFFKQAWFHPYGKAARRELRKAGAS